jgi:PTH2 family peptidyl-tRNA hydrolase
MGLKQVLVLRKDLGMRKGKMIAQGAHASLTAAMRATLSNNELFNNWLEHGATKIAVSVDSENELHEIHHQAKQAGLPTAFVVDKGTTEFQGIPTATAVAIGPAPAKDIDKITGELKLL